MRRNFLQILNYGKFDLCQEYHNLYEMVYETSEKYLEKDTRWEVFNQNFFEYPFIGNCLSLSEFDKKYGFNFEKEPENLDLDYFILLCEYVYNMLCFIDCSYEYVKVDEQHEISIVKHITNVIKDIGYTEIEMKHNKERISIFVPKDNVAIAVSESPLIPHDVSYKVIAYHHHSMKGDLEAKKETIRKLADLLEPKRENLKNENKQLASDLFCMFNKMNIRHNNCDPSDASKYCKYIAEMSSEDLETWYDEIFQMCLLAFMELDHVERKAKIDELKSHF